MDSSPSLPKSWSIHTRPEIIQKYQILERVGSGAYSDVYRARRISDGLIFALKEVHDYQSAFREIEALQILQGSPNVVVLHEYFWREDEDAVLVLEFLATDLASVIGEARKKKKGGGGGSDGPELGLGVGEVKRWMIQILSGVDACHRSMIVHRDLKPSNLLISEDGVLKLADFGQARILLEPYDVNGPNPENTSHAPEIPPEMATQEMSKEEYFRVWNDLKSKTSMDYEADKDTNLNDGDASCLATCTTSDVDEDLLKCSYSYEVDVGGLNPKNGAILTSCVGTRWFRAPELLYGSTSYGHEIDLWSLGCIFSELFTLDPLFPGTADIDQISRIFSVLGNLTEEAWPGCSNLPDFQTISFNTVENPIGLEACLLGHSLDEISIVKRLVCYDPANRATAMELLNDKYFHEEPLPVPVSELWVPSSKNGQDGDSSDGRFDYGGMGSDSDFDDFGPANVTQTGTGFSIQFP